MSALFATDDRLRRRRMREKTWRGVLLGAATLAGVALATLIVRMLADGLPVMGRLAFWFNTHSPRGIRTHDSGILDAVLGSMGILVVTMLVAVPVGTAAGVYLHEYARRNRLTDWIRATVSNLAGVPSVVYGLLGLAVFVRMVADWSGLRPTATNLAASLTLAVLVLPILIVATEEALKTVPHSIRHASDGLGATRWQTIRHHVLPYALPGILTGQILALSRAAGETAPLLIIGLPVYSTLAQSKPALAALPWESSTPLQVRAYNLAQDARAEAIDLAAGAIVILLLATLLLNVVAITLRHRMGKRIRW